MSNRASIPSELRRSVLVEAGHRCAIPTCRNPDVDIHHIIPWEKVREHRFSNLIALCPNCHRRADAGKIDRKSLLMYKARLAASGLQSGETGLWSTERIEEQEHSERHYEVDIEYPVFREDTQGLVELNAVLRGDAYHELIREREDGYVAEEPDDDWWAEVGNAYASTYHVALFHEAAISIRISANSYGAGAAHGHHASWGINYYRAPLRIVRLPSIFKNPREAIKAISTYCVRHLEAENHSTETDDWVREGAAPKWENFNAFVISPKGIEILFQTYQVGCYADGPREVLLTSRFLEPLLNEDEPLLRAWVEL